jgi:predicted nucleic acid-binding Zn ribbon protein
MCYAVDTTDRGPRCGHAERRRPRDAVVLVLALFLIVVALRLR